MPSPLTQLVAIEQINQHRRAAERDHLAAAVANGTRRERSVHLPSLRLNRSLQGVRKRLHLA